MKTQAASNLTSGITNHSIERQIDEMKTNRFSKLQLLSLTAALLSAGALSSLASDPVGIYAYVDKVVLEPNDTTPERIQVWGGFALAEGGGYEYGKAQPGYMYFKLKPGKEEVCRNEW